MGQVEFAPPKALASHPGDSLFNPNSLFRPSSPAAPSTSRIGAPWDHPRDDGEFSR